MKDKLIITGESIRTELINFKDKPYQCLFEYVWNSFDAGATTVKLNFNKTKSGIGYIEDVKIIDNGRGWDFDQDTNTDKFLASSKAAENSKNKTLPRGKLGRGRYVFIWMADKITIHSKNKLITLAHDTEIPLTTKKNSKKGTEICFININESFSNALSNETQLKREILLEFGWFLEQNKKRKIQINNIEIQTDALIKEKKTFDTIDFSEEIIKNLADDLTVEVILWNEKTTEWSEFYFLNKDRVEIFKKSTGFNKKSDNFWHSVYIVTDFFNDGISESDEELDGQFDFGDKEKKKLKNQLIREIQNKLIILRKPYLVEQSTKVLKDLKDNNIIPSLIDFGIYDEESFDDLLKQIYVISPSLFVGKNDSEKKFICATFAGLLTTQDNQLIKVILEQLQTLTLDEQTDLLDILQRTSLSCVVRTIKEIDHRLNVIEQISVLLSKFKDETLEVRHLQKILDENFWIFGEQFRLFSSTEGRLHKVLYEYAKTILEIDEPKITSTSKKELDLFLVKTFPENDTLKRNVVVEIKRPSNKLGKSEYDQIEQYSIDIMKESLCNGKNIYWEFYLIGNDYNDYIQKQKIDNAKNYGDIKRGLTSSLEDGRVKIYVRKWSDILDVEWGYKMKYLKDKLIMQTKQYELSSPDKIVSDISKKL